MISAVPHIEEIIKINRLPKRIILFKKETEYSDIEEIIKYISDLWGGFQTLLVPYLDEGIDVKIIKMIKEYDTDFIYSWKNDTLPKLVEQIVLNNCSSFKSLSGKNIKELPRYNIYPETKCLSLLNKIMSGNFKYYNIDNSNKNNDFYAVIALTGILPIDYYENFEIKPVDNEVYYLDDKLINTKRYNRICREEYYPFDITLQGVEGFSGIYDEYNLYLVIGKNIEDYCLYFNLCRFKKYVLWIYNYEEDEHIKWFISDYIDEVVNIEVCGSEYESFDLKNYNIEDKYMNKIIKYNYNLKNDFNIIENFSNQNIWVSDNISVEKIETKPIKGFEEETAVNIKFLTEIQVKDFMAITKGTNNKLNNSEFRISKKGITFLPFKKMLYNGGELGKIKNSLSPANLIKISLWDTVKSVMLKGKYKIELSNQGKYAENILGRFDGGLDELSDILKDDDYIQLFNLYVDNYQGLGKEVNRRLYFSIEDLKNKYDNDKVLHKMIDYLLEHDILHPGYLIKCNQCSYATWTDINELAHEYTCTQCKNKSKYNYKLNRLNKDDFEPRIYYKLDEMFYLAWKQDFYVPILTLKYFKDQSKEYFEYISEIDVISKDTNKKYCEVDFICNVDGKLIVGECKKNNEIDEKQIDSYVHLVHNLGFDILVFATMKNEWKDRINNYLIDKNEKFISIVGSEIICLDVKNEKHIPIERKEIESIYEIKLKNRELKDIFNNGVKLSVLSEKSHFKTKVLWDLKYIKEIVKCIGESSKPEVSNIIKTYSEDFLFSENLMDKLSSDKSKLFVYLNYQDRVIDLYECQPALGSTYEEVIKGTTPICRVSFGK